MVFFGYIVFGTDGDKTPIILKTGVYLILLFLLYITLIYPLFKIIKYLLIRKIC